MYFGTTKKICKDLKESDDGSVIIIIKFSLKKCKSGMEFKGLRVWPV